MNNLVKNVNGTPKTSSRLVARKFGKRHANVLRDIDNLDCSSNFNELNFELVKYTDQKGEKRTEFILTKDGFTFLVMGYTGKEAAKFKEDYINAFNKMEEAIKNLAPPSRKQLAQWVVEQEEIMELQRGQLQIQAPKVAYHDQVLNSKDVHSVTVIAKELNMTANSLNRILKDLGVQYYMKNEGCWVLTAKYQNRDYTKTKTWPYKGADGKDHSSLQMYWTERGRKFIHQLLQKQQSA